MPIEVMDRCRLLGSGTCPEIVETDITDGVVVILADSIKRVSGLFFQILFF